MVVKTREEINYLVLESKNGTADYFNLSDVILYTGMLDKIFNYEKVVVNCKTEEEAKEYFKFLTSKRIVWISGTELKEKTLFNSHKEKTCYEVMSNGLVYSGIDYYIRQRYTIIDYKYIKEEIDMQNIFTKSDLKVGMVVKTREEINYLVLESKNEGLILVRDCGKMNFSVKYNDDLKHKNGFKEYDIMKVFKIKNMASLTSIKNDYDLTLIWERKNNSKEIEALRAEIKNVENSLSTMKSKLNTLEGDI
jgi:hypothetical protein